MIGGLSGCKLWHKTLWHWLLQAYLTHLEKTELKAEQKAMRKYYRKAGMPLRVPED